jgi:penicillin-binding protein 2
MRIRIVNLIVGFLFILMALAVFNLSVIQGRRFRQLSNKNSIRLLLQPGARGKIFDRNGMIIVDNYLTYDVLIMPQEKGQLEQTLLNVARILDCDTGELKKKFKAGFLASFLPVRVANNIEIKKAIALEELKLNTPGIVVQPHPLRKYPYGSLASHVLGYLNEIDHWRLSKLSDYGYKARDIVGFGGVEEKFDYFLREKEGALSVEVDHQGKFVRVLGFRPPQNGNNMQLTLDLKIQKISESALSGRKGSVVILKPDTGEIIAMANSPDFSPAAFVNKSKSLGRIFTDSDAPLINRAISGLYPPGSVFKLVVASAALETKKINSMTSFYCPGSLMVGRRKFSCWNTHLEQDLVSGIAHSCDVFFYHSGLLLGAQSIHDYALKFGFDKPTSIDLPYEAGGFVPSPLWKRMSRFQTWYDGDTANFSIGQGDLMVTPLQVARMTAVFANNGMLINPYVVQTIENYDVSSFHKKATKMPLKDSTLNYVRQGMRKTVSDPQGTASVLADLNVAVAGKTGTVQVPRGQPHAWFCGYFPYKNPKYVICVFLEYGGSGYAACVLTKQILFTMAQEGLI